MATSDELNETEVNTSEEFVTPIWLQATRDDLVGVDFEVPLAGSKTADCREISNLYQAALEPISDNPIPLEPGIARLFALLSAITSMYFKPNDVNEPFGPMLTFADGRRSPAISDFRNKVDVIADLAERTTNPVLKARLNDLCWILERKRAKCGLAAISAYTDIVDKIQARALEFRFDSGMGGLHYETCEYIRRALQIGRYLGWDKPETIIIRELVQRLREQTLIERDLNIVFRICDLDLEFRISDANIIGDALENVLLESGEETDAHWIVDLWKLAAKAFHLAKRADDRNRCMSEAAERLVKEAEPMQESALLAAHFLSSAIAQLGSTR